jgi:hypothetical protein
VTFARLALLILLVGVLLLAYGYSVAVADPVVRRAEVRIPGFPADTEIKAVLISDVHVAGPDMPPERLTRIVEQINGLGADIVLMAGDFIGDKDLGTRRYGFTEALAPLGGLRSRLGTFAVLGNHDYWRSARDAHLALGSAGVKVLGNSAARAGPLAIGGLDDAFTGHDDLQETLEALKRVGGVPILVSHSPDPFARTPSDVRLMLAGHTHCGQIRLPLIGALTYESQYGDRYGCGIIREDGKTLVVGAGLGTSVLPLRIGAVPDMWLITIRGAE